MGKWRFVVRTAAVALTGLSAAFAPTQAAFSDEGGKPELVTLGMSQAEVEALVGPSSLTCWNYDRGAFSNERICFRDGLVHIHGMQRHDVGHVYFETAVAPDWPPPAPDMSSKEIQFGMDPKAVTQRLGKPNSVDADYWEGTLYFHATFVNGKLASFENRDPMPPSFASADLHDIL